MIMNKRLSIPIKVSENLLYLEIYPETNDTDALSLVDDAATYGESPYQLNEGCSYEFHLSNSEYTIANAEESRGVVRMSKRDTHSGRIIPNTFVGSLELHICQRDRRAEYQQVFLEVRSVKATYRDEYRFMLEEIAEHCTDLLLAGNSPVNEHLIKDFARNAEANYQRFAFIKAMLDAPEFEIAVHKIIQTPTTTWEDIYEEVDIRNIKRMDSAILKQMASAKDRRPLNKSHSLARVLPSLPSRVRYSKRMESIDTPENRFIKYALSTFQQFVYTISSHSKKGQRLFRETEELNEKLQAILSHSFFKEISSLNYISLNSPVLQRKEGYREIARIWHLFDLASKLIWSGGEDVYNAGKKDVATLYEYWVFFKLLSIFTETFKIDPIETKKLFDVTDDGLHLTLKKGKVIAIQGTYINKYQVLNVQFAYNRTFSGQQVYPKGGSWTDQMKPDYTLSLWPIGYKAQEAEELELIVHLHFDAKYRIKYLSDIFEAQSDYQRTDLLKMHAYRDAIRRTSGAYVLYPGAKETIRYGYHEILPGIGAFSFNPSPGHTNTLVFKQFIHDVMHHLVNKATQRELLAYHLYHLLKDKRSLIYDGWVPNLANQQRLIPPQQIQVLVGYYRNNKHLDWILQKGLYNLRLTGRGSKRTLQPGIFQASLLLLYGPKDSRTNKLYEILEGGPMIFAKEDLIREGYPHEPSEHQYLVLNIKALKEIDRQQVHWKHKQLPNYSDGRSKGFPFSVNLMELMDVAHLQRER